MSHKHETIICPNCGYHATGNFCAQCGQETHLHNETFIGLILHFIGHYFHYDSKFFKTLKALWFSPGKLTIAYLDKQRMRYIPPISLYIFISAVYFLVHSLLPNDNLNVKGTTISGTGAVDITSKENSRIMKEKFMKKYPFAKRVIDKLGTKDESIEANATEIYERMTHQAPKVMFFMIPLMAFVLQLLFFRRKELYYVNHVIFALHYHSFWFSIRLIQEIYPFKTGAGFIDLIIMLASAIYFVVAMRNVYKASWLRSLFYSIITAMIYSIFVGLAFMAVFFILFY